MFLVVNTCLIANTSFTANTPLIANMFVCDEEARSFEGNDILGVVSSRTMNSRHFDLSSDLGHYVSLEIQ